MGFFSYPNEVNHRSRGFSKSQDVFHWLESLDKPLVQLSIPLKLYSLGSVRLLVVLIQILEVHQVRALRCTKKGYLLESI